ncbi:MAG: hypothetical protein IPO66_19190 [Rhodanobacteraceae bacterium]|nr:hypothetical protein [Rhodanobacteraceae bacterium]
MLGWLLVLHAFVPPRGLPGRARARPRRRRSELAPGRGICTWPAWVMLALSYSYSATPSC